jgi:methylglutaconyl-CoA hydratase
MILAPASATFGYPEVQRGFVPAIVMTLLRRSVGEKAAFDLAATGRLVGAGEAQTLGLVSRVFPDDEFESSAPAVLAELAGRSATALALTKQQFYQLDGLSFEAGIHLGADVNAISRTTPDFKEAIAAFLSK